MTTVVEMGEASVQPLTSGATAHETEFCNVDSVESELVREVTSTEQSQVYSVWLRFGTKILLTLSIFLVATLVLERFADEEVTSLSLKLMDSMGLPGLFILVFLADFLPQPFTYVPLIFMAVKGSVAKPIVLAVCSAASYSAAVLGYVIGLHIRRLRLGNSFMERLTQKYPHVPGIMKRKGAVGVACVALLPIPFAMATWTAGSLQVTKRYFALAAAMRVPKIALFVLMSRCAACGVES